MPWLGGDTLEPVPDRREGGKVVVAMMREVRVGIERDVSDRVAIGDKIPMAFEMALHHAERAIAFLHPILEGMLLQLAPAPHQHQPEIGGADIRLDAVLLEEHPLHRLRAIIAVFRAQPRSAGEMPEDRIRFGNEAPRRDFEQRSLAVGILGHELGSSALAFQAVNLLEMIGQAQLCKRQPDLVAVARSLHRIERIHRQRLAPRQRAWTSTLHYDTSAAMLRCQSCRCGDYFRLRASLS